MQYTPDTWLHTPWQKDEALGLLHKRQVRYGNNSLQHFDVWTSVSKHNSTPPAAWIPSNATWIVYIHGGAWRDPLITSESLIPALGKLGASSSDQFVFASISYSLSPYPDHETCPSDPGDEARNSRHPQHAADVVNALSYMQSFAGFGHNYVLVGHSCGATLAFQVAMTAAPWQSGSRFVPPRSIAGLNGMYALPELVSDPGEKHRDLRSVYELLVRNAYGDDQDLWRDVSPASVPGGWAAQWPGGRRVLLFQSVDDKLVPFSQAERLRDALVETAGGSIKVELIQTEGEHDDPWEKGYILADVLGRIMNDDNTK